MISGNIQEASGIEGIESAEHLDKKVKQVEELREQGEGWYDACLRIGENDAQKYVLTQLMLREVREDRDNND